LWEQFEAAVVPPGADTEERSALREAYRAGMLGLLTVVKAIGEPQVPEEDGVAVLSRIVEDLKK
jgi:hypothetical protein